MKKSAIFLLLVLGGGASLVAVAAALADFDKETPPDFYFTRLVYDENGGAGAGRWRNPTSSSRARSSAVVISFHVRGGDGLPTTPAAIVNSWAAFIG
jgi:hypothetical protein